jgi:hypothetical protein
MGRGAARRTPIDRRAGCRPTELADPKPNNDRAFPAWGQGDFAARPMAAALEKIFGHAVVVENRAGGAGGSIGNAIVARAAPDGYTLLMTVSSFAVLPEADRCPRHVRFTPRKPTLIGGPCGAAATFSTFDRVVATSD